MFVEPAVRQAEELQTALRRQVQGLRPGDVPLGEAAVLWQVYDGLERLASAAKAVLAGRVDESRVWAREGDRSAGDYLARVSGSSRGAGRSLLDTGRKLAKAPGTEAELRRGGLSRAQAEAIADAAAVNPAAEDELLHAAARESLAELRERCARVKAKADPDPEARHRRIHRDRRLRQYTDAEGAWNAIVRGTPDAGAIFNTALQPIIDELFQQARRDGRTEPREAYAFDGLMELARRAHNHPHQHADHDNEHWGDEDQDDNDDGDVVADRDDENHEHGGNDTQDAVPVQGSTGGKDGPDANARVAPKGGANVDGGRPATGADTEQGDAATAGVTQPAQTRSSADRPEGGSRGSKPRRAKKKRHSRARRTSPRFLALLRVDLEALRRGRVEGDELCEITGAGPVPASVARGLLGDAILKLVITRGVDVVNVTHLGRGPTDVQRVAALWTSPYCANQGCPNVLNIQHDHRQPWAQVHRTEIGNLDRLCGACHHLKTHKGWALVDGKGRRPLVAPADPRHPNNQPTHPTPLDRQRSGRTDLPAQGSGSVVNQRPSREPVGSGTLDGTETAADGRQGALTTDQRPPRDLSGHNGGVGPDVPSPGSLAVVPADQRMPAGPTGTRRHDPTLFENTNMTPAA